MTSRRKTRNQQEDLRARKNARSLLVGISKIQTNTFRVGGYARSHKEEITKNEKMKNAILKKQWTCFGKRFWNGYFDEV